MGEGGQRVEAETLCAPPPPCGNMRKPTIVSLGQTKQSPHGGGQAGIMRGPRCCHREFELYLAGEEETLDVSQGAVGRQGHSPLEKVRVSWGIFGVNLKG